MKQIFTSVFIVSACAVNAQSFETLPNSKDTINFIDQVGKKQGKWVLMGKHKPSPTTCYKPDQKTKKKKKRKKLIKKRKKKLKTGRNIIATEIKRMRSHFKMAVLMDTP